MEVCMINAKVVDLSDKRSGFFDKLKVVCMAFLKMNKQILGFRDEPGDHIHGIKQPFFDKPHSEDLRGAYAMCGKICTHLKFPYGPVRA